MKEDPGVTGVPPVLAQSLSLEVTLFRSDETILAKTLADTTAQRGNYEELLEGGIDCGPGQLGRRQIPPAPL
jgi:hypothetical protein